MDHAVSEHHLPEPCAVLSPENDSHLKDDNVFGYSVAGQPLTVRYCGNPQSDLRILILAGQHGDEADARNAAAEFVSRKKPGFFEPEPYFAVVIDANPDGALAGTRRNSQDLDLNRDHLLLCAPETSAIHNLAASWKPDLIIDVHTYRPWRRELLPYDFVYPQDVMIDFPTNPAVCTAMTPALQREALEFVKRRMAEASIRCERYTLIRPGVVRHSNVDILDARNTLALRFDTPVVLIEGRRSSIDDSVVFTPPRVGLLHAIDAVIAWTAANGSAIRQKPSAPSGTIPVQCSYAESKVPCAMEMQSASRGLISKVQIPGAYFSDVKPMAFQALPAAYGVPRGLTALLAALEKQRFETAYSGRFEGSVKEIWQTESITTALEEDLPALPGCALVRQEMNLEEFVIFPADQTGGRLLALMLEPESQFGPHRFHELSESLQPGLDYPVIRIT